MLPEENWANEPTVKEEDLKDIKAVLASLPVARTDEGER